MCYRGHTRQFSQRKRICRQATEIAKNLFLENPHDDHVAYLVHISREVYVQTQYVLLLVFLFSIPQGYILIYPLGLLGVSISLLGSSILSPSLLKEFPNSV